MRQTPLLYVTILATLCIKGLTVTNSLGKQTYLSRSCDQLRWTDSRSSNRPAEERTCHRSDTGFAALRTLLLLQPSKQQQQTVLLCWPLAWTSAYVNALSVCLSVCLSHRFSNVNAVTTLPLHAAASSAAYASWVHSVAA